jgi:pimeloyl-ACP methyl ester carboxylesterase
MTIEDARRYGVELEHGPLEVVEHGSPDAPPILFVHGVLANGALWEGVARRLASRWRCIVPSWPLGAHSAPMHPDADLSPAGVVAMIEALLTTLGIERAILVGNDSGGALCQMLVAKRPELVHALVLTSCDAYEVWLPAMFKPFELAARIPGALFVVAQLLRLRMLRALPFALGWLARRMPREVADGFVGPFARSPGVRRDLGKFLRGISPRLTLAASARFGDFDRPVLIAWSRDDRFFSRALAERLTHAFPRAELSYIDDAYTFSAIDRPEELARLVASFLEARVERSVEPG